MRRRRLVALTVLIVLLALLAWGVWVLGGWVVGQVSGLFSDAEEEITETTEDEEEDQSARDPEACDPADLSVAMNMDADASRTFVLAATNAGEAACLLDAGALGVVVHSGEDRIWSTHDCSPPGERMLLLPAGDVTEVSRTWDGYRSAPGCSGDRNSAQPGTYQARATLVGSDEDALDARAVFEIGG